MDHKFTQPLIHCIILDIMSEFSDAVNYYAEQFGREPIDIAYGSFIERTILNRELIDVHSFRADTAEPFSKSVVRTMGSHIKKHLAHVTGTSMVSMDLNGDIDPGVELPEYLPTRIVTENDLRREIHPPAELPLRGAAATLINEEWQALRKISPKLVPKSIKAGKIASVDMELVTPDELPTTVVRRLQAPPKGSRVVEEYPQYGSVHRITAGIYIGSRLGIAACAVAVEPQVVVSNAGGRTSHRLRQRVVVAPYLKSESTAELMNQATIDASRRQEMTAKMNATSAGHPDSSV